MQKIFQNEILDVIRPALKFNADGTFEVDTALLLEYAMALYNAAVDAEGGKVPHLRKPRTTVTHILVERIICLWERCPLLELDEMAKLMDLSEKVFYSNPRLARLRERYCGKSPYRKNKRKDNE